MSTYYQLNHTIIYPHLYGLCKQISNEKHALHIDSMLAFPKEEPFLPGTISSSFCYILTSLDPSTEDFSNWCLKTSEMIIHNSTLEVNTFGILEFLSALYELDTHDLLDTIVSSDTLLILKEKLHWNQFVDDTNWTLKKGLPTNYFGVAFRVALLREQLGWDSEYASTKFLDILTTHITTHSGEYLYMDETNGEGRYDKYTVSIASELCELLVEFKKPIPEILKHIMQKCCDILVQILDPAGNGFSYGRSIGSHGEAVIIETFPVAMRMGIFSEDQLPFIYTATYHAASKIANFWFNPSRGGFNIWDDGRRTDHYRNKTRVLEVNLDMSLKMIRAENHLKHLNLHMANPLSSTDYHKELSLLPTMKYFRFEKGIYERGLVVVRTDKHVFSLPIINGGHKHYNNIPYLPIPFCIHMIQGTPDEVRPMLVPMITLEDNTSIMPLSYIKEVTMNTETHTIQLIQDVLCDMADPIYPKTFDDATVVTTYTFNDSAITREDAFTFDTALKIDHVKLCFETFSTLNSQSSHQVTLDGLVESFEVEGMEIISTQDVSHDPNYHTSHAGLCTAIYCTHTPQSNRFTTRWTIKYAK